MKVIRIRIVASDRQCVSEHLSISARSASYYDD